MKAPSLPRPRSMRVVVAVLALAGVLQAGGPLVLHSPGVPFRWMGDPPTALIHPDAGSLGSLDAETARATLLAAAENWEAVDSSSLTFQNGGAVGSIQGPAGAGDFAVSNIFDFVGIDNGGVTPIVFDSEDADQNGNGDIFDALGLSFGVIGVGFPEFVDGTEITEGMVILNGAWVDPADADGLAFRGVITHELGHMINLAHTVVNGQAHLFGGSDALTPDGLPIVVGDEHLETMYPFGSTEAGGIGVEISTPHLDDIAILSTIYPNPVQPLQNFGSIEGRLLDQQDEPRTGGQMIVRNQSGDPLLDAVSAISGDFAGFAPNNPFVGSFALNRLTPGGQYSLEVRDTVDGGFSTPVFFVGSLPGPEEYYSGNAESHDDSDDPFSAPFLIEAEAGETVVADVLLNQFPVPANDLCVGAVEVGLADLPFMDTQLTQAATMGAGEIPSDCLSGLDESKSVWYSLSNGSKADVDLVVDTGDSEYLTAVQVFRGSCASPVIEEDECAFLAPLTFTAEAGEDYLIRVTGAFDGNPGGYLLFSVAEPPPPPPNDDCTGAIAVASADLPFSGQANTTGATETGEPESTCGPSTGAVWYSYTNSSGSAQHLSVDTDGSDFDTVLQAYRGSCAQAVPETCNDDSGGLRSRVALPVAPGETILLKPSGFFETGDLVLNMDTFQEAPNDDCEDAISVVRSDLPFMDMVDARGAENQPSEPETTCGSSFTPEQSHSVYYGFTNDSTLAIEIELSSAGSEYDTVLQVYTGTCGTPVPEACDDDSGPGLTSELTLSVPPAATYLIKVSSWGETAADILHFSARAVGAARSQDVEMLVSSRQQEVQARGNLDYTVAATNFGLDSLSGVSITTTLPEKTLLVSAGGNGVTCSQSTPIFTCDVGSLNPAQRIEFPVSVSPQVAGQTSLHGEADWDQRTLDPPSTTVVRQVAAMLTIPTSFAGPGPAADLQGTGVPFVGAAVVNLTDEENELTVEGFGSEGELTYLREEAALLPARGQTAFIAEDLPGLPVTTRTLLARGHPGELSGFFMTGNSPIDRLDGIGRSLPEARKLYLPLARSGQDGQTTRLDFFNPYPEQNDSSFRLFDVTGTQIAEARHSFPAWGSLKITLQDLFDSPGPVDGYIEADAEEILRGFQIFSSNVARATAVATPVTPVSQLWSPHYFLDDRIGGATELRLINLESSRVLVIAQFFDELADRINFTPFFLEPGEVFSEDLAAFFGLQPPDDRLTGHLRLDLVHEKALGFVLPRVRVIGVINFSTNDFYSSLPLIPFPRSTTRFLQVAQSNAAQLFTGLAILSAFPKSENLDFPTMVHVQAIDSSGQINAEKTLELADGERFLGLLSEDLYFGSSFEQIGGHLEINADFPVFIFALFGDFRATYLSAVEGQ